MTGQDERRLRRAVTHLKALERAAFINRIGEWFLSVSYADWRTWVTILYSGWFVVLLAVFVVKPLWLLRWNESLNDQLSVKVKVHETELSLGIALGYVTLIRLFAYRLRVLDAWVSAHIEKCRRNFQELPTVRDRKVHVPIPVRIDGQLVADYSAETLRSHIRAEQQCRWLIFGEGGAEKPAWPAKRPGWPWPRPKSIASLPI